MKTLLLLIAFTVVINALLHAPLLLKIRRLKRAVRLQKAKAEISACAEEMQVYLAKRHVVCGELVHDVHYEVINKAQHYDKFLGILPLISRKRRTAIKDIRREIDEELKKLPPNIRDITNRFNIAFLRAAYYRQPNRFWLTICISLGVILSKSIFLHIKQRQLVSLKTAMLPKKNSAKIIDFQNARPTFDTRSPVYAWAASWLIAIGVVSGNAGHALGTAPSPAILQQPA
jgi:hypothetical protein